MNCPDCEHPIRALTIGAVYACSRCGRIYMSRNEKQRRLSRGLSVPDTPTVTWGRNMKLEWEE